ncbi:MAG: hypothetical protein ACK4KV_14655 [Rhodocyclaceae bacterium]
MTALLAVATALIWPAAASAQAIAPTAPQAPATDYSEAETAIFLSEHLAGLAPPRTLEYHFRKHGSLEQAFEDKVRLKLAPTDSGGCCDATADFLSGMHSTSLPEVEDARANPVILYFLEHDVRDMNRLTQGQPNHFRKRIRMAIFNGAKVDPVQLTYQGQSVAARRVSFTPYADDPNRHRFARYADKHYVFWLSNAVPGGVFGMATWMRDSETAPGHAQPLVAEELYLDGATPPDLAASLR